MSKKKKLKNERFETKKEEIRHRQYLTGAYYAQGKGNDEIIDLLQSEHSLSVSRATIGRDIYLIRRKQVKDLEKDIESFKSNDIWANGLNQIKEERRQLWRIVQNPKNRASECISAFRQIQALRTEETAIYERLGVLNETREGRIDDHLFVGRPMPGDRVTFSKDGNTVTYKRAGEE